MMNKRGSALVNVLMVTTVLLILGVMALRIAAADTRFSRLDNNRSVALQLAEGGVDFAIEQIVRRDEAAYIDGIYAPLDDLSVEIAELDDDHFLIYSTADVGNSTRQIEVEVRYDPMQFPFAYSLYVGEEVLGDTGGECIIKNVTFKNPVFFAASEVNFGSNVLFEAGVHFENEDVVFKSNGSVVGYEPFSVGVGYEATYGPSGEEFPEVEISAFASLAENDDPILNNPESSVVDFNHLMSYNYYTGDVAITWQGSPQGTPPGAADSNFILIACEGNVRFEGKANIQLGGPPPPLFVLARGNVTGNHGGDNIDNIQLPLYIYSQGDVLARNNLKNVRSLIGRGVSMGPGTCEVAEFELDVPGLEDAWPSVINILNWKN